MQHFYKEIEDFWLINIFILKTKTNWTELFLKTDEICTKEIEWKITNKFK